MKRQNVGRISKTMRDMVLFLDFRNVSRGSVSSHFEEKVIFSNFVNSFVWRYEIVTTEISKVADEKGVLDHLWGSKIVRTLWELVWQQAVERCKNFIIIRMQCLPPFGLNFVSDLGGQRETRHLESDAGPFASLVKPDKENVDGNYYANSLSMNSLIIMTGEE
ncbi:uncharacterized protein BT62DRAFT_923235 [Guyanagaster necrorhizus]|uniref:Uncharacterized protein n=1 Tax=Guyanagaster necrorhizus TaxID=856835 RepID=A0A9P7VKJ4_9AGAR|nr:uncharacterized protein BT62DRAFT_923235 [Guyanagaster necrorhizus MCA 3950]KAG7441656.1 hypothetical protein BT62DRAFT_923235 [Guyanagaster necrorhizus MCA 3950]